MTKHEPERRANARPGAASEAQAAADLEVARSRVRELEELVATQADAQAEADRRVQDLERQLAAATKPRRQAQADPGGPFLVGEVREADGRPLATPMYLSAEGDDLFTPDPAKARRFGGGLEFRKEMERLRDANPDHPFFKAGRITAAAHASVDEMLRANEQA
jgi:hypothetical protein